jgi:hypothetical protein
MRNLAIKSLHRTLALPALHWFVFSLHYPRGMKVLFLRRNEKVKK